MHFFNCCSHKKLNSFRSNHAGLLLSLFLSENSDVGFPSLFLAVAALTTMQFTQMYLSLVKFSFFVMSVFQYLFKLSGNVGKSGVYMYLS